MKRIAVAQLGSNEIDDSIFVKKLALSAIRLMVPIALRAAAKKNSKHADKLEASAVKCEQSKNLRDGKINAREARAAAYVAACAAAYAADAAYADDEVLGIMAEAGVQALIVAKSPGAKWLDLI